MIVAARRFAGPAALALLMAIPSPAAAQAWRDTLAAAPTMRPAMFAGATLTLARTGPRAARPSLELGVAPALRPDGKALVVGKGTGLRFDGDVHLALAGQDVDTDPATPPARRKKKTLLYLAGGAVVVGVLLVVAVKSVPPIAIWDEGDSF